MPTNSLAVCIIGFTHRLSAITTWNARRTTTRCCRYSSRANSAGTPLEYSDLLLATATAKWENLDARSEIHNFTDAINQTGNGYSFGKDFGLKACLYLSENLPIQYKVKNFTKKNLRTIEENWETIKEYLSTTVQLTSRLGIAQRMSSLRWHYFRLPFTSFT